MTGANGCFEIADLIPGPKPRPKLRPAELAGSFLFHRRRRHGLAKLNDVLRDGSTHERFNGTLRRGPADVAADSERC
ncbi:hypothetical protein PAGU2638_29000 [Lysobacter sp. PAGU 2638]